MPVRLGTALLATLIGLSGLARADAQDYPSRPIRVIVPAAAGGAADIGARLAADALGRVLDTSVFVENRKGRVNVIEAYLAADADGYTILTGTSGTLTIIPAAKQVAYDVERDFAPLGIVWSSALALAVRPTLGVRTFAEFLAAAKARPGKLTIGSSGSGTISHLTIALFRREAGIDLIHIPFRSSGESLTALLGGQVDAVFGDPQILAPQLQAGAARALAVTSARRDPALPDVPTMGELGFPSVVGDSWFAFVISAKTPPVVVKRLQDALAATRRDGSYQRELAQHGVSAGAPGPDALARLITTDLAKWRAVVAAAGVKLD